MAIDKMRMGEFLEYISNVDETIDSFAESREILQNELIDKIKNTDNNTEIFKVEMEDLVLTVEKESFLHGILVGVKLKNILDSI